MKESTVRFVDHAFWEKGTLSSFLTEPNAYVNDLLAPYYGMAQSGFRPQDKRNEMGARYGWERNLGQLEAVVAKLA